MLFSFAKHFHFIFMFSTVLSVIFVSQVSSAPVVPTPSLLNDFINSLQKHNCMMPTSIDLPFNPQPDPANPWKFLSIPLQICQQPEGENPKFRSAVCNEIFSVMVNISCLDPVITLPRIKLEVSIDVCPDLKKKEAILTDGPQYIGKRLTDEFICEMFCFGEVENACRFLLWAYEVQSKISDYFETLNNPSQHLNEISNTKIEDSPQSNKQTTDELNKSVMNSVENTNLNPANLSDTLNNNTVGNQSNNDKKYKNTESKMYTDAEIDLQESDLKEEQNQKQQYQSNEILNRLSSKQGNSKEDSTDHDTKVSSDAINSLGTSTNHEEKPMSAVVNTVTATDAKNDDLKNSSETIKPVLNDPVADDITNTVLHLAEAPLQTSLQNTSQKISEIHKANEDDNEISNSKDGNQKPKDQKETQSKTIPEIDIQIDQDKDGLTVDMPKNGDEETNHLPQVAEDGEKKKTMTETAKNSEKDNATPAVSKDPKLKTESNELSGTLPTESSYLAKSDSDFSSSIKKDPKSSFTPTVTLLDKMDDKTDLLFDREQEPNMDMESMEGDFEGDFSSVDNGRSVDIQKIRMSQGTFPEQDDSHFFFYFLSMIFIIMAGYLLFHNKQKIIALIVEGRHEKRRRSHGGGYKKLETK